jgi:putative ABC transport system permease protein
LQLVKLLSKDFLILVLVAFVLACPVGAYLMNQWLSQFVYRIPVSVWIFLISGVLCFAGALLTVGVKSWNAAHMDPAKALKYE